MQDITDQKMAEVSLRQMTITDELTGAYNRGHALYEAGLHFESAGTSGMPLSIAMIDIDHFKRVNDTYGHDAGDCVLKALARLAHQFLATKTMLDSPLFARFGGEEFLFLLPGASDAGAFVDPRRVLINGDMALYHAKERGRNRHEFFSKSIQEELESTKRIADEILQGIERCEFVPYYQPVVDAQTLEPVSVEALVRWRHPNGDILTPNHFLKVAQDINVLATIDSLILSQAIIDLDDWQGAGLPIQSVSTNVSFGRLSDEDLVPSLRKLNIRPGTISFEFLESIFLDEFDDGVAGNIEAIKNLGIGIDVDDFGTGHTSFVSLLRLMPRRFKIDRQLISPVASSAAQRQLVNSIVDIGRTLGIKVVAEGVETAEQARVLGEIGCDFLQGFAYGRPMPAPKLARWLRNTSRRKVTA